MDEIQVPFSMVLLAKRNTGKTVMAEYIVNILLDEHRVDGVYLFSRTCKLGDNWRTIPEKYKYEELDYKVINKIILHQYKLVKSRKQPKNIILVFDDIIDSGGNVSQMSNLFNELFARGRHFKISVMLCNQYVRNVITPTVRSNIDYLLLSCNTNEVLSFVYSMVVYDGTKKEFIDFVNANSADYYFVLYDNLTKGNDKKYYKLLADTEYIDSRVGVNKY